MSTHTQIIYHIVFSTKHRKAVLNEEKRDDLYRYIWGILKNKKCHLYRIGGVDDHVHIVTNVHPSISLADLVRVIKTSSSRFIGEEHLFPNFEGWQSGYGAFTHTFGDLPNLVNYVKNQKEHHHRVSFEEEYRQFLKETGIDFDERFLFT